MVDQNKVNRAIASFEGKERLLYSNPDNPYESIYIKAQVEGGCLTITDRECGHAPDGRWSHRTLSFDAENTQKVFRFLLSKYASSVVGLANMLNGRNRTAVFQEACDARGIQYKNTLSF